MKIDLHTHTVASGHAFGTVRENVKKASENGIKLLAITDHGPALLGAPREVYFRCGDRMPKIIDGVRVLFGVEANIINEYGDLDLSDEVLKKLDVVMAGLHSGCGYEDQGIEKNTEVLIKAMDNPYLKMISHPYSPKIKVDIEKITKAAIKNNIVLELNASYFFAEKINNKYIWNNIKKMVQILKENNQRILINSDAHSPFEIGEFKNVKDKFEELGINDNDILNNSEEEVLKLFNVNSY